MNRRLWLWTLVALITYSVAGAALFGPFLDNPFLMDDEIQVTHNVHVQDISNWQSYFTSSTMDSGGAAKMGGIYFKPLMTIYFATVWHFFPNEADAFRVPLLICQILSATLIFIFLVRFFEIPIAFGCGLLFVIHPINSEIVAYIADAQDALYMTFGLLALTTFTLIKRPWLAAILTAVLLMAGLLSKETGALFLVIVPMASFYFDRARFKAALATSFVVGVLYAGLRYNSGLLSYEHKVLLIQQATYLQRLTTVPLIVWHYIETFFFPLRISLVTDFVVKELTLTQFWLPILGVGVFGVLLRVLWTKLRSDVEKRVYEFAIGILFLWFALHGSVLLPLDGTYADRWFYLGVWAFLILIALTIKVLFESLGPVGVKRAQIATAVFAVLYVGSASARTWVRLVDWETPLKLYTRELEQRPFDALMANNVGFEYFHRGEIRLAEKYFLQATENNPVWDVAWNNVGACAQRLGEIDRAISYYDKSVSLGSYYLAYENFAALTCAQRIDARCTEFLQKALTTFPLNPSLRRTAEAVAAAKKQKPEL